MPDGGPVPIPATDSPVGVTTFVEDSPARDSSSGAQADNLIALESPAARASLVISMINQKGGVGKSTISILLGGTLASAGYAVAFDDCDDQGSVSWWAREIGKLPLKEDGSPTDVLICDTPGRLDLLGASGQEVLRRSVAASDRVVIVAEKSHFSLHATIPTIVFAQAHLKPGAKLMLLLNKVRVNTRIGREPVRLPAEAGDIAVLETALPLAAPYERVQSEGMAVVTGRHRELVLKLALEILK
jgi:chromosome partitioning protein